MRCSLKQVALSPSDKGTEVLICLTCVPSARPSATHAPTPRHYFSLQALLAMARRVGALLRSLVSEMGPAAAQRPRLAAHLQALLRGGDAAAEGELQ